MTETTVLGGLTDLRGRDGDRPSPSTRHTIKEYP